MSLKVNLFVLFWLFSASYALRQSSCNQQSSLYHHRRHIYEFAISLLKRVCHGRPHFVVSPLSTWLQLVDLFEGTRNETRREIQNVTKCHKNLCFRSKFRAELNKMDEELKDSYKRKRLIVVDELLNIDKGVKKLLEKEKAVKVMPLDFNDGNTTAGFVNETLTSYDRNFETFLYENNFKFEELLLISVVYFHNLWKVPFNKVYTRPMPFYSEDRKHVGDVNMMIQINKFNYIEMKSNKVKILELPCLNDSASMLIFLPTQGFVEDIFYMMKTIRLPTIFQMFRRQDMKTVKVSLPRFKITSLIEDIPELLYDMGVKQVFDFDHANFQRFSKFKMHASTMQQKVTLEVTEEGVNAFAEAVFRQEALNFTADRPFGFMLVDKKRVFMIFAGIYSEPELY